MIKRLFSNWWFISIGMIGIFAILFLFALPLFVGFLRPVWVRLGVGVGLVAIWLLWFFLRKQKAKKGEAALAEAIVPDPANEEEKELRERMRSALSKLRSTRGAKRNYLYSCPWYVIIGPPGAGKTTALMNSGLRFPFTDQSRGGSGGTRSLDFLFSEEAVLVDTAGRYTTQDSNYEADRRGWESLLKLLKKHRPIEPVNAVFVALPIDDLQTGDVHKIDDHAATVRQRLYEIRTVLETDLPIYLLLTKGDLLAGFVEYFDDLDVDGRRAVLGHTFDLDQGLTSEYITSAFDQFTNNVAARQPKRLQEELDLKRRGLILGFPSQLHQLRAPIHRFIEGAFLSENREKGRLRGVYLTSGLQDGNTLDRILDSVTRSSSNEIGDSVRTGRAFFLNRLLTEVVFPEAGLPVPDNGLIRRRKNRIRGAMALISLATLLLTSAWVISFMGNRAFQNETVQAASLVEDEIQISRLNLTQVGEDDASLEEVLPLLNQLRNLPEGYGPHEQGGPALLRRFGLFQSSLSRRNKEAYHNGLRRVLLPRVMLRLEEKIRQNLDDSVAVYEPLKIYLMLGGAAPDGRMDVASIKNYIERDWAEEIFQGSELRPVRDNLSLHLDALTKDRNLLVAWEDRRAPLDANLIEDARLSVRQLSLAELAYAIMRERASNLEGDWRMDAILQQNDSFAFANPDKVMNITVPHFFTRDGFKSSFSVRLLTAREGLKDELWVLEESADNASIDREIGNLRSGITLSYVSEYIAQWEKVIGALEPGDYFNDAQSYRAFRKAPSPLKKVLSEVRDNTTFAAGAADVVGEMALKRAQRNKAVKIASRVAEGSGSRGLAADEQIASHFLELNQWVGDGSEPAEIDDLVNLIGQSMEQVLVARNPGGDFGSRALATAMAPLQKMTLEVPELASGFVEQVASGGSATQLKAIQQEIAVAYQRDVYPVCQDAVEGRYPFVRRSQKEATLKEVRAAFGDGGRVNQFIDQKLTRLLSTDRNVWSWRRDSEVSREFSSRSAMQFQKAHELGEVVSSGLPLSFKLVSASPNVDRVELTIAGFPVEFQPGSSEDINWTVDGNVIRSTELKVMGAEELLWQQKDRGTWSLFRVLDKARIRHPGKNYVMAKFSQGSTTIEFQISFPEKQNPFTGSGLWSVQCSPSL